VPNFEDSKRSFMFLFSHTNEMNRISKSSLIDARKSVLDTIIRTEAGTQDESIKLVLKFMRQSLKKEYPFCDVFHPIMSDAGIILKRLNKLHWIPGTELMPRSSPGRYLTVSSQYKLKGELNKLGGSLERLLPDLRSGGSSPSKTTEVIEILSFLEKRYHWKDLSRSHLGGT